MTALRDLDLVTPAARLVDDLGTLSAVAVLGFASDAAERTTRALLEVAGDSRWTFVDVRKGEVPVKLDVPVLVIATGMSPLPPIIAKRVGALVDKRSEIRQKVIVLCDGATSYEQLPRELQRISYSEFIPR